MAKAKLHELIAVEGDLEGTAKKIIEEAATTFSKRADHFTAARREIKMIADTPEAKAEEVAETRELVTTVAEKLDYTRTAVLRYWDAVLQKESTNQIAKADLVVDGATIAADLPATFLLGMETKLKALRSMYEAIPTLEPGAAWVPDAGHAHKNVFMRRDDEVRSRTKKVTEAVVLYPATDKHPAQVKEVVNDVTVGQIITRVWSGMVSPADKSDLLARIDTLLRACKRARQRANATEVVKRQIGKSLLDYINTGTLGAATADAEAADTE